MGNRLSDRRPSLGDSNVHSRPTVGPLFSSLNHKIDPGTTTRAPIYTDQSVGLQFSQSTLDRFPTKAKRFAPFDTQHQPDPLRTQPSQVEQHQTNEQCVASRNLRGFRQPIHRNGATNERTNRFGLSFCFWDCSQHSQTHLASTLKIQSFELESYFGGGDLGGDLSCISPLSPINRDCVDDCMAEPSSLWAFVFGFAPGS